MDLLEVKTRVAEALVESIFRRARFTVEPCRTDVPALRIGRESFAPDFSLRHADDNGNEQRMPVTVKSRSAVDQFMSVENQRGDRSVFAIARRHWPNVCFVFVTDRPQPNRSCFQALVLGEHPLGKPYDTVDLAAVKSFGLFAHNVADHEELLRRIFGLLTGA